MMHADRSAGHQLLLGFTESESMPACLPAMPEPIASIQISNSSFVGTPTSTPAVSPPSP